MDYLSILVRFIITFKLGEREELVGGEEQLVTNHQNPHRYKGIFSIKQNLHTKNYNMRALEAYKSQHAHQRAGKGSVVPLTLRQARHEESENANTRKKNSTTLVQPIGIRTLEKLWLWNLRTWELWLGNLRTWHSKIKKIRIHRGHNKSTRESWVRNTCRTL